MAVTTKDLYALLDKSDHHARSMMAVHTELRSMLAQLHLPDSTSEFVCPKCGADRKGPRGLADHLANVHGEQPEVKA